MDTGTRAATAADDAYVWRMTAFTRLAVDQDGRGPSAATVQNYVEQGLLPALRDSNGRLLFRRKDAKLAVQIYHERARRHGQTGKRGFQPVS